MSATIHEALEAAVLSDVDAAEQARRDRYADALEAAENAATSSVVGVALAVQRYRDDVLNETGASCSVREAVGVAVELGFPGINVTHADRIARIHAAVVDGSEDGVPFTGAGAAAVVAVVKYGSKDDVSALMALAEQGAPGGDILRAAIALDDARREAAKRERAAKREAEAEAEVAAFAREAAWQDADAEGKRAILEREAAEKIEATMRALEDDAAAAVEALRAAANVLRGATLTDAQAADVRAIVAGLIEGNPALAA